MAATIRIKFFHGVLPFVVGLYPNMKMCQPILVFLFSDDSTNKLMCQLLFNVVKDFGLYEACIFECQGNDITIDIEVFLLCVLS